jgi:protein TonB
MRYISTFITCFLFISSLLAQEYKNNDINTVVEKMPEFNGGEKKLREFLSGNLNYPAEAIEKGIAGTVYITFIIEKNGQISNVKVLRGLGGGLTEEAIRVVKLMPRWLPGKQNGKPVRVQFTLPIKFTLR